MLCDCTPKTFWKRQTCGDTKKSSGCRGSGGAPSRARRIRGAGRRVRGAVTTGPGPTCVQPTDCAPVGTRNFGDDDVSGSVHGGSRVPPVVGALTGAMHGADCMGSLLTSTYLLELRHCCKKHSLLFFFKS